MGNKKKKWTAEKNLPVHSSSSIMLGNYVVYGAMVVCGLVSFWVIWSLEYLPLQDLPDHIARTFILKNYLSDQRFQDYFRVVHFPTPYTVADLCLIVLQFFFSAATAGKAFATLAIACLVAGVFVFVRRVVPKQPELVLVCFAMLFSKVFAKGNMNFLYGLGVLFCLLGIWWPKRNCLAWRQSIWLAIAGAFLYLTHLVDAFAWICILSITISVRWLETREIQWKNIVLALPPLFLTFVYLIVWKGDGATDAPLRLCEIFNLNNIWSKPGNIQEMFIWTKASDWKFFAPAGLLYLVCLVISIKREEKPDKTKLVILAMFLFWVLISPYDLPNLVRVYERFLMVAILWSLSLMNWPEELRSRLKYAWIAGMVVVGVTTGVRFHAMAKEFEPVLREYQQGLETLPEHSLVCPLKYTNPYFGTIGMLLHFDKYAVPNRRVILPNLFETKFVLTRYRDRMPLPPEGGRRGVTREMLSTYDYFVVFGKGADIEQLEDANRLNVVWTNNWLFIYKNMIKEQGESPRQSDGT